MRAQQARSSSLDRPRRGNGRSFPRFPSPRALHSRFLLSSRKPHINRSERENENSSPTFPARERARRGNTSRQGSAAPTHPLAPPPRCRWIARPPRRGRRSLTSSPSRSSPRRAARGRRPPPRGSRRTAEEVRDPPRPALSLSLASPRHSPARSHNNCRSLVGYIARNR